MSMRHGTDAQRRQSAMHWMLAILLLAIGMAGVLPTARIALADDGSRPSVLVIDANVGDGEYVQYHWLGDDAKVMDEKDGLSVLSVDKPSWWSAGKGAGDAPTTFLLKGDGERAPITTEGIAWALDVIRLSGAEPRTFVVAMGTTGLRVREYAEDLATTKQSARADVVGTCFCGTPHLGYSTQGLYPESSLWDTLAGVVGLTRADLLPDSTYLKKLNAGVLPAMSRSLNVCGVVGDMGFGSTDGAAVVFDYALPLSVSNQVTTVQVPATIGQELGLSHMWLPFASSIDYPNREVDGNLAERLSAMKSYGTSEDALSQVVEFYDSWFAQEAPVTHNSSVLALDFSGSMIDAIPGNTTKLDAAKSAATEYLHAMQACALLPQSAPMDVEVLGFSETLTHVAKSYDDAACKAIGKISAKDMGETNIGIALEEALTILKQAPTCANRHILLLSDGASTRGKSNEEMMSTSVKESKKLGITIDVVGFGNVGESNAGFLKTVSSTTGGTYYEANDEYDLKCNFLRTHYASLGLDLTEEELSKKDKQTQTLATADSRTSALMVGVVAEGDLPQLELTKNGKKVDEKLYEVQTFGGFASIQLQNPSLGEYALTLGGNGGRAHVFAVRQLGIPSDRVVSGEQQDWSLIMLAATGGLLVMSVAAVLVLSVRRSSSTK